MESKSKATFIRVFIQEVRVVFETFMIDLVVAMAAHYSSAPYEWAYCMALLVALRTKHSDWSKFPKPICVSHQLFRVVLCLSSLFVILKLLELHKVAPIPAGKTQSIDNMGFETIYNELTFVTLLFSISVIILRLVFNVAEGIAMTVEGVKSVLNNMHGEGDGPPKDDTLPYSISFPSLYADQSKSKAQVPDESNTEVSQ